MTEMPTLANPFHPAPGASPPFLSGREAEVAAIHDAAARLRDSSPAAPMVFLGLRGLGKTVLLNKVRNDTPGALHLAVEVETGVPLHAVMRDAMDGLRRRLEGRSQRVVRALSAAMRVLPNPQFELPHNAGAIRLTAPAGEGDDAAPTQPTLARAIDLLYEAAADAKTHVVITIDEIQDVDVAGLRTIASRVHQSASTKSPMLLACAGLPEAQQTIQALRTYARTRWERFDLRFLTRAQTAEAIRIPLRNANVAIEDAALDILVAESAGYPYFVQRYASAAWNERKGKVIRLQDVNEAIRLTRPQIERKFYAEEFASLTDRERAFCKILAALGEGPQRLGDVANAFGKESSQISSIRTNLLRKGILFSPSSGKVEFRMPLADRYVREHDAEFTIKPKIRPLSL